jgi:hypothetical protein
MATRKKVKEPVQPCPCKIEKMEMVCSHGRRSDTRGFLEIVADPTSNKSDVRQFGPSQFSVEIENAVACEGSEEVTIELFSGDGCKDKIKVSGPKLAGKYVDGKKRTETLTLDTWDSQKLAAPHLLFENASPVIYSVIGETLAGKKYGRIIQYPGDKYEYSIKVDGLGFLVKKFNEAWEKWGTLAFGWAPATVTPKLIAPVGMFKTETYYKE